MGKESEFEYFTEADRQMGTKLMKKMLNLVSMREMQIKAALRATVHTR